MTTHTETITWHKLPGQMPDAELTVLLCVEGADDAAWPGYWDGEAFCWCDTGGEVSGAVLGWADMPAGVKGLAC